MVGDLIGKLEVIEGLDMKIPTPRTARPGSVGYEFPGVL